ncbi:hypothetical protein GQ472_00815 [archaeon]|nr:hypothetical protein [archaeon]
MKRNIFIMLAILLIMVQPGYAWDWDTHEALVEQVCIDFGCGCFDEIKNGSIVPDKVFRDNFYHHCYNLSEECPESDEGLWQCPTKDECPTYEKEKEWLEISKSKDGCEKWYAIGVASHYFFDSKVFWHRVQKEEYYKCHQKFERDVGDEFVKDRESIVRRILIALGLNEWEVCACGICTTRSELMGYALDFTETLEDMGFERKKMSITERFLMTFIAA